MSDTMDEIEKKIAAEVEAGAAWMTANDISIHNIKICGWMSQETVCFKADFKRRGILVGYAENDGHGGCTSYHFHALETKHTPPCPLCPRPLTPPDGFDSYIDNVIGEIERAKLDTEFRAKQEKAARKAGLNVAFIKEDGGDGVLSAMLTKCATVEEFKASKEGAQFAADVIELKIFRTPETAKAARIAAENKFLAKCTAKANKARQNMVIERTTANEGAITKIYFTRAKDMTEFLKARPEVNKPGTYHSLIGFDYSK